MKQMHKNIKRRIIGLLVLAVMLINLLPVYSVAAPSDINGPSQDQNDVSVLSVTVQINAGTGQVYSDLILHNNSDEDKNLTFALPAVTSGIDPDSLTVTTKAGQEMKRDADRVTLTITAGGNAGVSYSYYTKKNMDYESQILFDLRQLSSQFDDQIGHLEWHVDMPFCDLIMVNAIHPVNYTVADNRISIVLDHFRVTDLLDRIYVSRTTKWELLRMLEESGEGDRDGRVVRFIVRHYREWFDDPDYSDSAEYYAKYTDINTDDLPGNMADFIENNLLWDVCYSLSNEPLVHEMLRIFIHLYRSHGETYPWSSSLTSPAYEAQSDPTDPTVYAVLISKQTETEGKQLMDLIQDSYEMITPPEESIPDRDLYYADFAQWLVDHEKWWYEYCFSYRIFCYPCQDPYVAENRRSEKCVVSGKYRTICILEENLKDPEVLCDYLNALQVKAVVRSKYLVKGDAEYQALKLETSRVGADFESGDHEGIFGEALYKLSETNPYYDAYYLGYSGTDVYPYEAFQEDLKQFRLRGYSLDEETAEDRPGAVLIRTQEPLQGILPVPVITHYLGYVCDISELENLIKKNNESGMNWFAEYPEGYHSDMMVYRGFSRYVPLPEVSLESFDLVMDQEIPARMRESRDAERKALIDADLELLKAAGEELGLASPEELGFIRPEYKVPDPSQKEPEETSEESSGESLEETSGEPESESESEPAETEEIKTYEPSTEEHSSPSEEQIQDPDESSAPATIVQTETGDLEPDSPLAGVWKWILLIGGILLAVLSVIAAVCAGVAWHNKKNK